MSRPAIFIENTQHTSLKLVYILIRLNIGDWFKIFLIAVPLTEVRRQRIALEDAETRRTSSRGLIPKAKVKTIKMTFVIILGEQTIEFPLVVPCPSMDSFTQGYLSSRIGHLHQDVSTQLKKYSWTFSSRTSINNTHFNSHTQYNSM